jgi:PAS domain S-box-containing protein
MLKNPPISRRGTLRILFMAFIVLTLALCMIGIATLGVSVRKGIETQSSASSDNTQWTLSQVDVEFLNFKEAISDALVGRATLSQVRTSYDIVYSRTNIFLQGRVFETLGSNDTYLNPLTQIRGFLNRYLPLIDGPDTALQAALPEFEQEAARMRPVVREFSLAALRLFSINADAQRELIVETLAQVGVLTALLIIFLLFLMALLMHFERLSRQHAHEVELSLNRIKAIVDNALDAVIVADRQGNVLEFNPAAERIFGYSSAEAIGRQLSELIVPARFLAAHAAGMRRIQRGDQPRVVGKGRVRMTALNSDKSEFSVELSIAQSEGTDGLIFISFIRDLSAEIAAEQELIAARDRALAGEKAKSELLAVMSHEMRTPLNGMLGTLELIQDTTLTPRQTGLLEVMQNSGKLLLHHVNDVLNIARLESGKMPIQRNAVNIRRLLDEVISNQSPESQSNKNTLLLKIPPSVPPLIELDGFQVRQILLNLISNAVKFTQNGAITVCVDYEFTQKSLSFVVADSGVGIDSKDIERIFEDFVTLDPSYTRAQGGTGLGLGITRRLVENLGGTISVNSLKGQGSTFRVSLPDVSPLSAPVQPAHVPSSPLMRNCKILVVEDNAINRLVVREMLIKHGHSVVEAVDGEDGVRLAGETKFDLIFMDISMPRMDGIVATQYIRASDGPCKAVAIIALTAHALPEEVTRFKSAGMQEVLIKPVTGVALEQVLTSYCGAAR